MFNFIITHSELIFAYFQHQFQHFFHVSCSYTPMDGYECVLKEQVYREQKVP